MKLHASGEDYLEAILVLYKKTGMVRSVDVARHMEVSKPSVCHAVATLRDGGFLTMDSDYFLHLTDVGRAVAEKIYERHCFFTEQLIAAGVDPETAEADACRIEHIISDESFSRLKEAAVMKELVILRLAVYEITNDANIPTGVAIDEAVELAKIYCSEEAPRFINGVLAKLA